MLNKKINILLINSKKLTWVAMLLLSLNVSGKNNNSQDSAQNTSAGLYTKEEMLKYAEMLRNSKNWVVLEPVSPSVHETRNNYKEYQNRKQKEFAEYKAQQQKEYAGTVARLRKQFEGNQAQIRQYMLMQREQYKRLFIEEQKKQAQK